MSTRAQVRFATRETGVSFNEHPNAIHAQFYVHSDGYKHASVKELRKGLDWFRQHNAEAYMVLLD